MPPPQKYPKLARLMSYQKNKFLLHTLTRALNEFNISAASIQFTKKHIHATIRILQIMGECAGKLSSEQKRYPSFEFWRKLNLIRDALAHLERREARKRLQELIATNPNNIFNKIADVIINFKAQLPELVSINERLINTAANSNSVTIPVLNIEPLKNFHAALIHRLSFATKNTLLQSIPNTPEINFPAYKNNLLSILQGIKKVPKEEYFALLHTLRGLGIANKKLKVLKNVFTKIHNQDDREVKKSIGIVNGLSAIPKREATLKWLNAWLNECIPKMEHPTQKIFEKKLFIVGIASLSSASILWLQAYRQMYIKPRPNSYKPITILNKKINGLQHSIKKFSQHLDFLSTLALEKMQSRNGNIAEGIDKLYSGQAPLEKLELEFAISSSRDVAKNILGKLRILSYFISQLSNLLQDLRPGGIIYKIEETLEAYIFRANRMLHKERYVSPIVPPGFAALKQTSFYQQPKRFSQILSILYGDLSAFNKIDINMNLPKPTIISDFDLLSKKLKAYKTEITDKTMVTILGVFRRLTPDIYKQANSNIINKILNEAELPTRKYKPSFRR